MDAEYDAGSVIWCLFSAFYRWRTPDKLGVIMKTQKWIPVVGEIVAACYDGKWGRAVDAEVMWSLSGRTTGICVDEG